MQAFTLLDFDLFDGNLELVLDVVGLYDITVTSRAHVLDKSILFLDAIPA